jgi:hypothetical protein
MGIPLRFHALDAETRDMMLAARKAPKRASKPRQARPTKRGLRVAARAQAYEVEP